MRSASSSAASDAFSQFPSDIFFQNSQHHATGLDILTPHGHFQAFAAPSIQIQAHRVPLNARPSLSTTSSLSNPSQDRLERDLFESSDARSSPSAPNVPPLKFAHFQPPNPTPSSPKHPFTKGDTRRVESSPPIVEDGPAADKPAEFFSARFLDRNNGPSSARTATRLGVPANQKFVEVKAKNGYRFNVSTPATVPQKRSFNSNNTRENKPASREGDSGVKKPRIGPVEESDHGEESPLRATRIELRTNKPLKNSEDIHMDVWRIILTYAPLKFLLDAKTINHRFNRLLAEESTVWCSSRINQYSDDMPGPPGQMTEQRYAQLLEGRGCQSKGCGKKSTGKVYWAFCLRLCKDCLEKRTMKEETLKGYILLHQAHYSLLTLLRAAVVDGGKYSRCRQINSSTGTWEGTNAGAVYLTSDVNAIVEEYERLVREGKDDTEISAWRDKKMEEVKALTLQIAAIEAWDKTRGVSPPRNRERRKAFFIEQAQLLNPPIGEAALKKMLAYKMSLDSNTAPTQQTWEVLKRKIVPYRKEAEKLVSFEEQTNHTGVATPDLDDYERLRSARSTRKERHALPEYNRVLDLGRRELAQWKGLGVDDADLALRVLNGVYQSYQQHPLPDTIAGDRGIYGLPFPVALIQI
jgi:hypothetical protein